MDTTLQQWAAVQFSQYKSFRNNNSPHILGIDKNITLLIGKNNSGKSSLLDVVETAAGLHRICQKNNDSEEKIDDIEKLYWRFTLDSDHLECGFSRNQMVWSPYYDGRVTEYQHASKYLGKTMVCKTNGNTHRLDIRETDDAASIKKEDRYENNWNGVLGSYQQGMMGVKFRRINADRDITPEIEEDIEAVDKNGHGVTNLVRMFINKESKKESLVEEVILKELNKILGGNVYQKIRVQQVPDESEQGKYKWEIFLEENGQRYALSKSGSGLKTIILVLVNLYLVPETHNYNKDSIIFAFEELENNLHPNLQRRLFDYLYDYAVTNNTKIILTSHSSVAINCYFGKEEARIYHIVKSDDSSQIIEVGCGNEMQQTLDDLGVKASDLFQANGIIWVEGPTDKMYIKRWFEVLTPNEYTENQDYEFMYYGGRLLAGYTSKQVDEEFDKDLVNMVTINRHSALVMDSDKKNSKSDINTTKKRIKEELENNGFLCWVTDGREIENYISAETVNKTYGFNIKQVGKYDSFSRQLEKNGIKYGSNKVKEAAMILGQINKNNCEKILNLKLRITELYEQIGKWKM